MKTLLSLLLALVVPTIAWAQYPNKPVRMIVPFAPGGASDFVGRILQPRLTELLGQQIVVDNRAGASGNIGMDAAAKSAPDGYTIYLGNVGTVALNPAVFPKLGGHPDQGLHRHHAGGGRAGRAGGASRSCRRRRSRRSSPSPRRIPASSTTPRPAPAARTGSRWKCSARSRAASTWCTCPTKAAPGPAVTGLVGGETHLMFVTASSAMNHVKSGRIRLIAVTSAKRLEAFPDAPTMAESGFPELTSGSWQGIFVPTGTPKDVVDKLYGAIMETMKTPEVRAAAGERRRRGRHQRAGRVRAVRRQGDRALGQGGEGSGRHRRVEKTNEQPERRAMANAGMVALDWQQRINWDRVRKYRLERAREKMKAHGLGAMLLMYDENVRYVTSTLTPGWNRLKPGLRYAMLCGDDAPVLFEQGDIGFQIQRHSPWIPKDHVR